MTRICQLSLCGILLCAFAISEPVKAQAPEPSIVPRAWEFEFTYAHPRPIVLEGVDGTRQWYWFMSYQVVNSTGREMLYIPEVVVATDNGRIFIANQNVPTRLFEQIRTRLNNSLLKSPVQAIGPLLQGEDHALDSIIIWPAFEENTDDFSIFIAGLSGETATIEHPETGDPVVLRKTLQIEYTTPGTHRHPQKQPVLHRTQRWIMR